MHKIGIENLISVIEEGTNSDGFVSIKCTFDIKNNTQYLWDQIEFDAFFFNNNNDLVSHCDGTFECSIMPGETHSHDLSHGSQITYKLEPLITGEPIKCVLYAKALHDFKIDLGSYKLPPLPNTHVKLDSNEVFEGLKFINGVMYTDSPDRRKRVTCKIELAVQNHTNKRMRIKLSGEELSNSGVEISGYNTDVDAMWQGAVNGRIEATTDQIKNASIKLHAWILAVVGSTEPY